jgi:hypothetical protein
MALQKQNVNFPINGTMDTKSDYASVTANAQNPNYDLVQDMQYTKTGAVQKRPGSVADTDSLDLKSLAVFNNELVALSDTSLYTRNFDSDSWLQKGNIRKAETTLFDVAVNPGGSNVSNQGAIINNLYAVVYRGTASICDLTTNAVLYTVTLPMDQATVVSSGNFWYFIETAGATLRFSKISALNPSVIAYTANYASSEAFRSAIFSNNRIYICTTGAANTVRLRYITPADTVVGAFSYTHSSGGPGSATIVADATNRVVIISSSLAQLNVRRFDPSINSLDSLNLIPAAYPANITMRSTGAYLRQNNSILITVGTNDANFLNASQGRVIKYELSTSGTLAAAVQLPAGYIPVSCPILLNNEVVFLARQFFTTNESTVPDTDLPSVTNIYLVNEFGYTIGRVFFGQAEQTIDQQQTPAIFNGRIYWTQQSITEPIDSSQQLPSFFGTYAQRKISLLQISYPDSELSISALPDQLLIPGAFSQNYNGDTAVEAGFYESPFVYFVSTQTVFSPVALRGGTEYNWAFVCELTRKDGSVISSPPTFIKATTAGTTAAALSTVKFKVFPVIPTNTASAKIVVYRTAGETNLAAPGSTFYKVYQIDVANDPGLPGLDVLDDQENSFVFGQPILYTTGGILSNDAPPNCSITVTHKNRVFTNDLGNSLRVNFSKENQPGEPLGFNDNLYLLVDGEGGKVSGLKSMDSALIIFKERAIFALSGNGPLNTGAQNDYQQPDLITTDVGCSSQNSIVTTPLGLMFKSAKGIYLLQRNLSVNYVGAPVEKYNSLTVTSSVLTEDLNEVRFYTREGTTLVYNYFFSKWSVFTNQPCLSAVTYKNTIYWLRTNGELQKETPGVYTENSSFYKPTLITGWLNFAGVQGFQRIYQLKILGKSNGTHKLRVSIAYDYDENFHNSTIIDPSLVSTYYGEGDYGSGVYGGEEGAYQWTVYPEFQKCQAIKIRIEEIETSPATAGFSLSNIAFSVGLKSSLGVTGDAKSFGGK